MCKYVNNVHKIANNAILQLVFNVNQIIKLTQLRICVNKYVHNLKLSGSHLKINVLTALKYLDLIAHHARLNVIILIKKFFKKNLLLL